MGQAKSLAKKIGVDFFVLEATEESMCAPFIFLTRACVKSYNDQFFLPMTPQEREVVGKKKKVFDSSYFICNYDNPFTYLSFFPSPSSQSDYDVSLIKHSRNGNLKDINKLVANASTKGKAHALSIAASGNYVHFVEALLTNGVDPTDMGEAPGGPEHGKKNQQAQMARMLTVEPALHSAARSGHMEVVKMVLKWSKSAILHHNSVDETPLDVAIKNKYGKIAVELCKREHYRNRVAHQGMYLSGLNTCIRGKQEGVLQRMLKMPHRDPSLLPVERVSDFFFNFFLYLDFFSFSYSFILTEIF